MINGTVYLICFDRPFRHARHYLGWTEGPVAKRMDRHRRGDGARLLAALKRAGIGWELVRTWPGDRALERKLKNRKCSKQLCPKCKKAGAKCGEEVSSRSSPRRS